MTIVVLVGLAAIWAGVLLPPYLQRRRATHPSSSVVDFHQQLAVLQRTGRAHVHAGYAEPQTSLPQPYERNAYAPRPVGQRMNRTDVMRRRRDVVATLLVAAGLSFVLALAFGGSVWLLHLLVDAALLGYVALLMQIQQQRQVPMARDNVSYLPHHASATQQALLRRSAN